MKYNLFLDDDPKRTPCKVGEWMPEQVKPLYCEKLWVRVWDYKSFVATIERKGIPEIVSFDHDLADEHYQALGTPSNQHVFTEKTGLDCMKWMINYITDHKVKPPFVMVHSMNPDGRINIVSWYNNFLKHYKWDNSNESDTQTDK